MYATELPLVVSDDLAWEPSGQVAELAALLRVLGDPRRLTLVALLARQERCVCEFQDVLGWPQNLVSHHLGQLRRAGLVRTRRDGQWIYYSLVPDRLEGLRGQLGDLIPARLPVEAQYGAAPRRCGP